MIDINTLFVKLKGVAFMENLYKTLDIQTITEIFKAFLECPNRGGCDNCILNENKIEGCRIGCFKLRDMAMQKVIDMFDNNGDVDGENNR